MPALKCSQKTTHRYGGDWGDIQILKNALTFLFQLKGIECQTKHPKFIIPTADEFLEYSLAQNYELDKTRAHHRGRKRKERRTLQAKSPLKEQSRMSIIFAMLFNTEVDSTLLTRSLYCILTVNYAMIIWTTVEQCMSLGGTVRTEAIPAAISTALDTDKKLFRSPLHAFCKNYFPCIKTMKAKIVPYMVLIFQDYLHSFSTIPDLEKRPFTKVYDVGQTCIEIYEAHADAYTHIFHGPIVDVWTNEGFL